MATLKQRMCRKNTSGEYDVIHLETDWGCIVNKPSTFPPSSHAHDYAPSSHTHSQYSLTSHTHTPASIGAAASSHTHSGYAASSHNHSASNITSGTLPLSRGGTGVGDINSLKSSLGLNWSYIEGNNSTVSLYGPVGCGMLVIVDTSDGPAFIAFNAGADWYGGISVNCDGGPLVYGDTGTQWHTSDGRWRVEYFLEIGHSYMYRFI